jgi:cobalt/nickel transport protein
MKKFVVIMLALSLVTAGGLSWFASAHPDGLEKVAQKLGFAEKAGVPSYTMLPDYTIPGHTGFLYNGLAGIIGVAVTFGIVLLAGRIMGRKKKAKISPQKEIP